MDDHRVEADVLEQHDIGGERLAQLLLAHRSAAVLDHDGAAVELPDVGKRLEEDLDPTPCGLLSAVCCLGQVVYSEFSFT